MLVMDVCVFSLMKITGSQFAHNLSGLMESLTMHKSVIAMINETLMDNHQADIALELQRRNYASAGVPRDLHTIIAKTDFSQHQLLPPAQPVAYAAFIDSLMGFK
jgi:beta-1,4-N-acetylglucosaminyltransferase